MEVSNRRYHCKCTVEPVLIDRSISLKGSLSKQMLSDDMFNYEYTEIGFSRQVVSQDSSLFKAGVLVQSRIKRYVHLKLTVTDR